MTRPKSGGQVPLPLKNISQISYNIICKNSRINPNNLNDPPKMVHRSTSVINMVLCQDLAQNKMRSSAS